MAGRQEDDSPLFGQGSDGATDGGGIVRLAIACCAVVADVDLRFGSFGFINHYASSFGICPAAPNGRSEKKAGVTGGKVTE
jgi:hypothetical protein